jgi:hypothetical protein
MYWYRLQMKWDYKQTKITEQIIYPGIVPILSFRILHENFHLNAYP